MQLRKFLRYALPVVLVLYFLWLGWVGLSARFAPDDMMNMAGYWRPGPLKVSKALVLFFSSFYRPMGGAFYLPIFYIFDMDPLPYRIGIIFLLCINTLLAYYVAQRLWASRMFAGIAAAFSCYHEGMFWLYFNTSQLYDVLCFTFWFAAFAVYLRVRQSGRLLTWRQTAIVSVLYICALNSKEMSVSFPILLLAYEMAYNWKELRKTLGPIIVSGILTLAFVIGKTTGPEALSKIPAYKPRISLSQFLTSNAQYVNELFYRESGTFDKYTVCYIWLAMVYMALRYRRPALWWGLALAIFGTLPIAFLNDRGGGCLPIPYFGYALLWAAVLHSAARKISHEPIFRWIRMPPSYARIAVLCAGFAWYASWMLGQQGPYADAMHRTQDLTWTMIQEMQKVRPGIKQGARVLFLDDPFEDWDMLFIAELVLRDRSSNVTLQRKQDHKLSEKEIAEFDTVLTANKDEIRRLR